MISRLCFERVKPAGRASTATSHVVVFVILASLFFVFFCLLQLTLGFFYSLALSLSLLLHNLGKLVLLRVFRILYIRFVTPRSVGRPHISSTFSCPKAVIRLGSPPLLLKATVTSACGELPPLSLYVDVGSHPNSGTCKRPC